MKKVLMSSGERIRGVSRRHAPFALSIFLTSIYTAIYGLFVGFLPAMFPLFKKVRYDMLKFAGALICAAAVMAYVIASKQTIHLLVLDVPVLR
jgi:hypothetical protein